MQTLEELRLRIEQELAATNYPLAPSQLYQPIDYILGLSAKRIRPVLVLMAHQLFNVDIEPAIKPALAIEVFHNFTLLHDDIMDDAPLRRGKQTVHKKWNTNVAILAGDTMLVQAYQLISTVDQSVVKEVLTVFSKAAKQVCEGQQWDMDFENQDVVSIEDYLKMIEYKTSVLLAGALQIGAITANSSAVDANHLYEFGRNMGIAFQLKDDLLDAFGNPDTFGKQVGGDILANKKTYLYLKALALASPKQAQELKTYFSISAAPTEGKVEAVKAIFKALDIPKHTTYLMKEYHNTAMEHLAAVSTGNKVNLMHFSTLLLARVN